MVKPLARPQRGADFLNKNAVFVEALARPNSVRYRGSKIQQFHRAACVRCLFRPTKYRYRSFVYILQPVRLHQLLPLLPLKNILLLSLKLNGLFGELLPKRRRLRRLLCLQFYVDLSSRFRRCQRYEASVEISCYCDRFKKRLLLFYCYR